MTRFRAIAVALSLVIVAIAAPRPAAAVTDQQELVERARLTIEKMLENPEYQTLRGWLKRARGVIVFPDLLRAGFLVGGEGGTGVLMVRLKGGGWSYPSFQRMISGSVGLQIGVQQSQLFMLFMTDKAVNAILNGKVKLGADVSIAGGDLGQGASRATTIDLQADVYTFAETAGAYAGLSFDGGVITTRSSWNEAFYGRPVTAKEILAGAVPTTRRADGLRRALANW